MNSIAVVSAGSFGTALAHVLSKRGHPIRLYVRETDTFQVIKATRRNATYLPDFSLDRNMVHATTELPDAVRGVEFVLLTTPSQYVKETVQNLKTYLEPETIVILTSKGMLAEGSTMSEIVGRELPGNTLCGLYGITFAKLIASGQGLSSMCIASPDETVAKKVAGLFMEHASMESTPNNFRIYISNDLRGVEFGGAMKNVYAIAMGIFDGYFETIQRGESNDSFVGISRHSLLSECIMEFVKFGLAHRVKIHTLLGSSGIGDIQACATELSRNYKYGRWRASVQLEKKPEQAPALHEGYDTVQAAMKLSRRYNLFTPILESTHAILFEYEKIEDVFHRLLERLCGHVDIKEENKFNDAIIESMKERKEHIPRAKLEREYETAFVSYRFSNQGEIYMNVLESICKLYNIKVTTGISEGAQPANMEISDLVLKKIKEANLYIAIFLNDKSDSTWLQEERAYAIAQKKKLLIFVEEGTPQNKIGKVKRDIPYHTFNNENFATVVNEQLAKTLVVNQYMSK